MVCRLCDYIHDVRFGVTDLSAYIMFVGFLMYTRRSKHKRKLVCLRPTRTVALRAVELWADQITTTPARGVRCTASRPLTSSITLLGLDLPVSSPRAHFISRARRIVLSLKFVPRLCSFFLRTTNVLPALPAFWMIRKRKGQEGNTASGPQKVPRATADSAQGGEIGPMLLRVVC